MIGVAFVDRHIIRHRVFLSCVGRFKVGSFSQGSAQSMEAQNFVSNLYFI